jgi:hypothetical protein
MSVKYTAADARSTRDIVANKNSFYGNKCSSVSSHWKGDIGDSYKNLNRRTMNDMSSVLRGYSNLSSKLDCLDRSITRAGK